MQPWRRPAGAVLCASLVVLLAAAPSAVALGRDNSPGGAGGESGASGSGDGGADHGAGAGAGGANANDGAPEAGGEAASKAKPLGSVNPLAIANPFCEERLDAAERRNCRVTGTPEGRYPTSNYGFDVHIDTGLDNIVGNFQALLAQIANAIWQAVLFVLNLVMTLLGWAFGLSPFTDNQTMSEVDRGLGQFYRAFTEPWLVVAMVAIGAWSLWRGIVRREVSQTIAATVLSAASILAAMWVIHEPRATIGTLADYSNQAAISVLAAPQRGSIADPVASYGEATAEVWNAMTIPGFAALDFSDADWALSEPDPELLETSNKYACLDAAYLSQIPPRRWQELIGSSLFDDPQCEDLASVVPAPRTNAEIYLRSSPGSMARDELWEEHSDDAPYASYLAIQGDGGAWARLPLVVLIALGLLGGICLLAWLALRIFVQTAVAFVLVLAAPLALFFPALGESGRRAFLLWAGTLLGALVSKLVYAALLSVVLFATTVVGSLADGAGAMMAFLVMAALWWAVFLKRESLVSFLSVAREGEGGDGRIGRVLGLYAAARVGSRMLAPLHGAVGRATSAAKAGLVGDRSDRSHATRRVARRDLDAQATRRLDARLDTDRALVAEQGERRRRASALGAQHAAALDQARQHQQAAKRVPAGRPRERRERAAREALGRAERLRAEQSALDQQIAARQSRERAAQAFVASADERGRQGGRRWSGAELAGSREAIRAEADRPVDDGAHAWRAGMSAERYEGLAGREREDAHAKVGDELRADKLAFGAIPNRPEGIVERRAQRRYRGQVRRRTGGSAQLHAERVTATRRRRAHRHPSRRGVSR